MTTPKIVHIREVDPFFVTIDGAARLLALAPKTVRNMLSLGTFPVKPRKLGGRVVFEFAALRAFAKSVCEHE